LFARISVADAAANTHTHRNKHPTKNPLPQQQEDERVLRKLLGKIKQQAEQDTSAAAHHAAAEEAALRAIVAKYSVSDLDIKALLEWKHATY
jgi:hypothetical protein